MDLTLYGVCFKLRGSSDLLDYVKSNTPVPIEVMRPAMEQMDSITPGELEFAGRLKDNWKKIFNERAFTSMDLTEDGGYEITCSVPDELLATVCVLTGLEGSKAIEEYMGDYLKNVCGIDTQIISVDVDSREGSMNMAPAQGFDIESLSEKPEEPAFEDVSAFGMDMEISGGTKTSDAEETGRPIESVLTDREKGLAESDADEEEAHITAEDADKEGMDAAADETLLAESDADEEETYAMADEAPLADMDEGNYPMEEPDMGNETTIVEEEYYAGSATEAYPEEGIPIEEGYPDGEEGYMEEEPPGTYQGMEEEQEQDTDPTMKDALTGIYKELVGNIRDRKLDERLELKIG